jgi:hypothetical protein
MGESVAKQSFVIGLLLTALAVGVGGSAWVLSPTLRERVLLIGLVSGVSGVQASAARALEDYPTRNAALALVTFVNWAHQPPIDLRRASYTLSRPDRSTTEDRSWTLALLEHAECLGEAPTPALDEIPRAERRGLYECLEEKSGAWEQGRRRRLELAGSGFRSLCALTGQTFDTRCQHHGSSASWGSLTDAEWSRALGSLNGWALQAFGGEILAAASGSSKG